MIVAGGVIPPDDYEALYEAGAAAVFGPGTVIGEAAVQLVPRPRRPTRNLAGRCDSRGNAERDRWQA